MPRVNYDPIPYQGINTGTTTLTEYRGSDGQYETAYRISQNDCFIGEGFNNSGKIFFPLKNFSTTNIYLL